MYCGGFGLKAIILAVKVSVIGTGYVGLVTASCFALGHDVCCLDINEKRIEALNNGEIPIYEPGLDQLLADCKKNNSFPKFTTDAESAISHGDFVFIAVGTPSLPNGEPNLTYLQSAAETIGKYLKPGAVVVNKSTVPVGSGNWVAMLVENGIAQRAPKEGSSTTTIEKVDFAVASILNF